MTPKTALAYACAVKIFLGFRIWTADKPKAISLDSHVNVAYSMYDALGMEQNTEGG